MCGDQEEQASSQFEEVRGHYNDGLPGYCGVLVFLPQDLEHMQAMLDAEFGRDSDDDGVDGAGEDSNSSTPPDDLFCPACNKLFKSSKA